MDSHSGWGAWPSWLVCTMEVSVIRKRPVSSRSTYLRHGWCRVILFGTPAPAVDSDCLYCAFAVRVSKGVPCRGVPDLGRKYKSNRATMDQGRSCICTQPSLPNVQYSCNIRAIYSTCILRNASVDGKEWPPWQQPRPGEGADGSQPHVCLCVLSWRRLTNDQNGPSQGQQQFFPQKHKSDFLARRSLTATPTFPSSSFVVVDNKELVHSFTFNVYTVSAMKSFAAISLLASAALVQGAVSFSSFYSFT